MRKILISLQLLFLITTSCQESTKKEIKTPFPKPTGKFEVGTETILFTRQVGSDSVYDRKLNIQIWYPAIKENNSSFAPYVLDTNLIHAFKDNQYLNLSVTTISGWNTLRTYALLNAGINTSTEKYPLIIFSHGFGMSKINYSNLCIEIASNGYIVAAIDHLGSGLTVLPSGEIIGLTPNSNGTDGKVIEFCQDASFVVSELLKSEKFKTRIDPKAFGMIGHSLGGAAALNIGESDYRFKACINLDGYLFGNAMKIGIKIPFLSILQEPYFENGSITDSMKYARKLKWEKISQMSNVKSFVIKIDGLMHFDFSDLPFIIPDSLRIKNGGVLPAGRAHLILSQLTVSFFDTYLKDSTSKQFQDVINKFDEVSYEIIH